MTIILSCAWHMRDLTRVNRHCQREGQTAHNVCHLTLDGAIFFVKGLTVVVNVNRKDEQCNTLKIRIGQVMQILIRMAQ